MTSVINLWHKCQHPEPGGNDRKVDVLYGKDYRTCFYSRHRNRQSSQQLCPPPMLHRQTGPQNGRKKVVCGRHTLPRYPEPCFHSVPGEGFQHTLPPEPSAKAYSIRAL